MKQITLQFIGFWYIAFILLIYILDVYFPGFIPSTNFLLPLKVFGIVALVILAWKGWGNRRTEPVNRRTIILWVWSVALIAGVMYNVYEIAGLPWIFFAAGLLAILIISGTILLYERSHSRRGNSDAA